MARRTQGRATATRRPLVEELESRLLFSADVAAAVVDVAPLVVPVAESAPAQEVVLVDETPAAARDLAAEELRHELVFVDAGVDGFEELVADLRARDGGERQLEVVVLDTERNGIDQISEVLAGYQHDLDAVHIVSHGSDGAVQLGNTWLGNDSVGRHAQAIATWGNALGADADLLFYGCDLAAGSDGLSLVNSLASLTGADVAASTDTTGHALLGGDWQLEHATGGIESQIAFGAELQQSWGHVMAVGVQPTTSTGQAETGHLNISHETLAGSDLLMLVGVAMEPDTYSVSTVTYNGVALTREGFHDGGGDTRLEIWSLVAPSVGTSNVVVTFTNVNHDGAAAGVMTFTGVDQSPLAVGPFAGANGIGTNATVDVDSAAGELVFGTVMSHLGGGVAPGGGQSEHWDVNTIEVNSGGTTEAGAPTVTTSWTVNNAQWAAAGVSIRPSSDTTAPSLVNNNGSTVSEGGTDTITSAELQFSDAEPAANIQYTVTSGPTNGQLELTTSPLTPIFDFTQDDIDSGRLLYRHNGAEAPTASFGFDVDDGLGNASTGHTFTFTVTAVNDAPTLGNGNLAAVDEDTLSPPGDTISSLFGAGFSDPDGTFSGIAVVGNPELAAEGVWEYSSDGSNWFAVGAVNDTGSALAIQATSLLRFVPAGDFNGVPTDLVLRGLDDTYVAGWSTTNAGESRVTLNTSTPGDPSAIAAATSTLSTSINAINDAPVLGANALTISEGGTVVLAAGNLAATDVEDAPGTLTFSVSGVSGGQFERVSSGLPVTSFTQADVLANDIRFVHDGNEAAPAYSVTVTDSGLLTDGPTPAGITYTPVNDAPTLGNGSLAAVDEDTTSPPGDTISSLFGAGFSDPDGTFSGIAVVGNPELAAEGVWEYSSDGTNWFAVGTVDDTGSALAIQATSLLRFVPAGDFNGVPTDLVLRGLDDTYVAGWSTTNAGESRVTLNTSTPGDPSAIAAATSTLSTSINAVNDAPVLGANALTISEGGTVVLAAGNLAATDVEDAPGTLTFSVSGVSGGQFERVSSGLPVTSFTQADVLANDIRFVHDGNEAAPAYSVTVTDSGLLTDGPTPAGITYTPVNDAPTLGNGSLAAVDEDTTSPPGDTISSLFGAGFSDPDGTFSGIAVVGNPELAAEGVWEYSSDGTNWFAVGTVDDTGSALAIQATSLLRFVPAGDFNGVPTDLVLRGLDDTYVAGWSTTNAGESRVTLNTSTPGDPSAIAAATSTLSTSINAVNDAPVLGANALTISEGGTVVLAAGNLAATDVEDAPGTLTFSVSGVSGGQFERVSSGLPVTSFTQADVLANDIRFVHDGNEAAPAYSVTVTDSGLLTDGPTPAGITYTPVNDAPTLGNGSLAAVDEDTTSPPGDTISSLFGGSFVDPDGTFSGIAVVGNPELAAEGVWEYSSDGTNWFAVGTVDDTGLALAIQATSMLRFVPAGDFNGVPTDLVLRGLDDTYVAGWSTTNAGESRVTLNTSTPGDPSAIAAATSTLSTSINAVNDAPVLGANALTISEGGGVILGGLDLSATDVDDSDPLLTFTVSGVTGGRFELVSAPGAPITSFLQSDVTGGQIRFVHDGTETVPSYSASVSDGSLGDGPAAAAITYTPVNDAPTLGNGNLAAVDEDTVSPPGDTISSLFGAGFSDPDGTFSGIAVVGNPELAAEGVWEYSSDGTNWFAVGAADDTGSALAIQATSLLRFVPAGDFNGVPTDLVLRGLDDTYVAGWSTTNAGESRVTVNTSTPGDPSAIAAATSTLSTSINAVNDAPVLGANALTISEGGSVILGAVDLSATDVDDSDPLLTFTVSGVTGGRFELVSAPGSPITSFLQSDVTGGQIRFVHDGSETTPSYSVTVSDGSLSDGPAAASITYTPVNDAPILGNNSLTISEGATVVLNGADLSASDVDDIDPGLVFTITGLSGGQFERISSGLPVLSFSQADITASDIRFVHDGGEAAPAYDVTVSDAQPLSDGPTAAAITFSSVNDAPTIVGAAGGQVTTDKLTRDPFTAVVIDDVDLPGDVLTVDVSLDDAAKGVLTNLGGFTSLGGGVYRFTGSAAAATTAIQGLTFDPTENRVAVGAAETTTFTISVDDGTAPAVTDTNTTVDSTSINDAPTASNVTLSVPENAGVGTVVGTAPASDLDPGDALTYSITAGNTGGAFTIDPATGVIRVADPAPLDFEMNPVFSLTVQVQDGSLVTDTATATVNVGDQSEVPILADPPPDPDPVDDPPPVEDSDPVDEGTDPVDDPAPPPTSDDVPLAAVPPAGLPLQESRRPGDSDTGFAGGRGFLRQHGSSGPGVNTELAAASDAPLVLDDAMWRALDLMGQDMGGGADSQEAYVRLLGSAAELGAAGMAAGFLTWFLRGGTLLTSLLSTLPLWSRLDPLPVLANTNGVLPPPTDEDEDDDEERAAGRILDEPGDRPRPPL